jgi:hypothetical protein
VIPESAIPPDPPALAAAPPTLPHAPLSEGLEIVTEVASGSFSDTPPDASVVVVGEPFALFEVPCGAAD